MPDRSKYPKDFSPHSYFDPRLYALEPSKVFYDDEELKKYEDYSPLLSLAELSRDYPEATHIHADTEHDSSSVQILILKRTGRPNPDYAAQLARYEADKEAAIKDKAKWEANVARWKAEEQAEKDDADYQVYLRLQKKFGKD